MDACSCRASVLQPSDLPTLQERGTHRHWDEYLDRVYGPGVPYPVVLSRLQWLYRCDCHVIDSNCNRTAAACSASTPTETGAWRQSCMPYDAPLQSVARRGAHDTLPFTPKVWMSNLDTPSCDGPFREAFVGAQISAHVRRNPSWRTWPNPEFHLAPYGLWLYPRPLPTCLANHTWVEVMRIREKYEGRRPLTWYYHAPGSGIWLNTGRSACVANAQRDARQYHDPEGVASPTRLTSHGWAEGVGIDLRVKRTHTRSELDTLQRNGPIGNMLEIVDVRAEAEQRGCGNNGCTCTGSLRAGWEASRPCRCNEALTILNCRGE